MSSRSGHPGSTQASRPTVAYQVASPAGTVWLGLGAAQLAALAITLAFTVGLMLTGAPLPVTLFVACSGAALSAWPVCGRTCLQWIPLMSLHTGARVIGALRWYLPAGDLRGTTTLSAGSAGSAVAEPDVMSRLWRPMTLGLGESPLLLGSSAGGAAALIDPRRHTVTVVLATTPTGRFGLLDAAGQDASLQLWGSALGTLLHLPDVAHLQWLTHASPDRHLPATGSSDLLQQDQAELLGQARAQARRHTTLLSVTATIAGSGSRSHRRAGHRTPDDAAAQSAQLLAQQVAAALLAADILSYPLPPEELATTLRHLLDPTLPQADTEPDRAAGTLAVSTRSTWTHCVTDDVLHRAFALTGWPRTSLRADWLAGLLHQPPAEETSRTLTVQARPVGQAQATRRARAGTAKARLDAADRQRLGFAPSVAAALDESGSEQTEAELVAGYRMADVTALLTLHAPTLALLDSASGQLRTTALTHRLELRPLHGQHQHALTATLPLGAPHGGRA